jgi:hypothetical protein
LRDRLIPLSSTDQYDRTRDDYAVPRFPCPCCGFLTLDEAPPGTFHICEVCWWEDDPVQYADPTYRGGANTPSLSEARENFRLIRASDPRLTRRVRPPRPDELPPDRPE